MYDGLATNSSAQTAAIIPCSRSLNAAMLSSSWMNSVDTIHMTNRSLRAEIGHSGICCVNTTYKKRSFLDESEYEFRHWRKSLFYQQRIFDLVDGLVIFEVVERDPDR